MNQFINSVKLNTKVCKGCINCLKQCPTQAIRVHGGKAQITHEFCIDCGKCIRICPHHAKYSSADKLDILKEHKYNVVLPTSVLFGQFNNMTNPDIVLNALLEIGFDDVFEVSVASELISRISKKYMEEHASEQPFISTHCPSVVRLIQIRFPELIPHLLPVMAPSEAAARLALSEAMKKTGLPAEDIGIIFITSCPAKVTAAKAPPGNSASAITGVISIKELYPLLLPHMKHDESQLKKLSRCSRIGIAWGENGGAVAGLDLEHYLSTDGIKNVMQILEDLEDEKIHDVPFLELHACHGGCVGGVMNIENPYVAQAKLKKLGTYLPESADIDPEMWQDVNMMWTEEVEYQPVFQLGKNFREGLIMMDTADNLTRNLPGLDCGYCGAPTCRALAEDIVRDKATTADCIYVIHRRIARLSEEMSYVAKLLNLSCDQYGTPVHVLKDYIEKLDDLISSEHNPLHDTDRN